MGSRSTLPALTCSLSVVSFRISRQPSVGHHVAPNEDILSRE
jgi:hypothetical protein